ncbi:MAG: BlaI/MecI/CopY family transcriptional regulator [Sedimentisphaerales bacterium]|nr:BlaI/MecI/CopY family transcriptional regulator [Sedimentisphaerales bacterium]
MTNDPLPVVSPSETQILRILWDIGSGTVQEVSDALPVGRNIAYATVQTLLRRLEKKGYITHTLAGKAHVFRPVVQKSAVIGSAVRSFVDRLFGGDPAALVHYLAKNHEISAHELEKLQKMIESVPQNKG